MKGRARNFEWWGPKRTKVHVFNFMIKGNVIKMLTKELENHLATLN